MKDSRLEESLDVWETKMKEGGEVDVRDGDGDGDGRRLMNWVQGFGVCSASHVNLAKNVPSPFSPSSPALMHLHFHEKRINL